MDRRDLVEGCVCWIIVLVGVLVQQGFLVGWLKVCGFDGILGWRLVLGLMEGSAQADTATASGATNRPCSASSG